MPLEPIFTITDDEKEGKNQIIKFINRVDLINLTP